MILESSRVVFGLGQDVLYGRILQYSQNFRVGLYTLHSFLFTFAFPCRIDRLDSLALLLFNLSSVFATLLLISFHCFGEDIQGVRISFHAEQSLGFAEICFDEIRVALDGLVAILQSAWES